MTKEEFEQGYCERSNISRAYYKRWFVTLPCDCEYEKCEGWAKVYNDPAMIKAHLLFYSPKESK